MNVLSNTRALKVSLSVGWQTVLSSSSGMMKMIESGECYTPFSLTFEKKKIFGHIKCLFVDSCHFLFSN